MNTTTDYTKVIRVIKSCNTLEQLCVARHVYRNFTLKHPHENVCIFILRQVILDKESDLFNLKENDDE